MRVIFNILTLLFFVISLAVYLPGNDLIQSKKIKSNFVTFLPQGWAFFTKNPQEVKAIAYKVEGKKVVEFNKTGNRIHYAGGLMRTQRILGREVSDILVSYNSVKEKYDFKTMTEALLGKSIKIVNNSITKKLCGNVIVNLYKEAPWVWFANGIKERPFNQFVKLEINCE
ncbi:hypothetical protein A9Q84_03090 [Halobacteriovorax marinus]|uniref:Uncharacterized protein n=1 Tax=Halobacteriovorax marinus TaxID=97084 RepID=A0A1Y5FIL0_9BACT|nr:hypothetical protein A9Q84_03090 [Halobacteriovorax marinus]